MQFRTQAAGLALLLIALIAMPGQAADARTLNGFNLDEATIPASAIEKGGPPRDGIPAINDPKFLSADEADFLDGDDRILGISIDGEARAYPIAILNWHEIVNDRISDQHFAVTFCPLCGTGMVFATNVQDTALMLGVSGLLYNSDMLLYDRNTESLWSQIMAEAVSGPLAGTRLPQIPVRHTSWDAWRDAHPDTVILSSDTGYRRDYTRSPYGGYERTPRLFFDVANKAPRDYHPKALVMGVEVDGVHKAYPFEELERHGAARFEDTVNGRAVTIVWDGEHDSAWAEGPHGAAIPTTTGFWFAWYAFYPQTLVFKGGADEQ